MEQIFSGAVHFLSSMGLVIFSTALAGALYNHFLHRRLLQSMAAGFALGLCSLLFHFLPFVYNSVVLYDYRFVLLVVAGVFYSSATLIFLSPFFLGGMLLTYWGYQYSLLLTAFALVYCFILSLFGLPERLKAILSFLGVIPIFFSIPLVANRINPFEGKTLIMYAILAIIFLCILILSFTAMLGRNSLGATTFSLYLDSLIFRYRNIYHFVIDRKKQKVRFSKRFYNTFELTSSDSKMILYPDFIDFLRYSLVNVDPSVDIEGLLLSGKNNKYVVITPKTNQSKYVSLICHKTWSGSYSGQVYDSTNTLEAEDMLYHLTRKDPVTGFKPYHVLKDEMTDIASLHSGFMLQVHIMITFTQMIDSMYGYEMEKEYFRCIAQMLRHEFPDAYFYSVNANEMKLIKFDLERTESANAYVERLRDFFYRPFEISGRRVFSIATMGILISDTMRCNTIEQANALINKAIFAKELAFEKKPGSIYIFKEQDYKDHIEQFKRSEQLPNLLRGGLFFTVYQPIIRISDATVYAFEALTRTKDNIYTSIEQLIKDSVHLSMDTELDIAMIQNISREVRQKPFPYNLFINKLTKTPILTEFRELSAHLKESGKTLYMELTEYMEHDMSAFQSLADELNTFGVRIAIDDYGAGYSSQSFISSVNPSIIKIDRELITDIDRNKRKETLVQGIVEYCNYLGIGCVAEGVSNRREMFKVIELGVHYMQGFYLGRPAEQPLDLSEELRAQILDAVIRIKKDGKLAYESIDL